MGGAFGDAYGSSDVAQPDARVTSNADQDVRVVGQEVPAGRGSCEVLSAISAEEYFMNWWYCVSYGHGNHPDSSSVADASRITDPVGFANPAPVDRAGGVPTTGGMK